jgi:hypothetical protein
LSFLRSPPHPRFLSKTRNRQNPAVPDKPFTLTQVRMLDGTYSDEQHGVTFRYPRIWKPMVQFGYHPPGLSEEMPKPIAAFGYEEGGFPRDRVVGPYSTTNLEGFGIVYSAAPAANTAECDARATSISERAEHPTVVFGGRGFSERDTGEAGMSQSDSGKLYATYVHPNCYLFETDVATASLDEIGGLTPAQLRFTDARLLDIMKSVRIVPSQGKPDGREAGASHEQLCSSSTIAGFNSNLCRFRFGPASSSLVQIHSEIRAECLPGCLSYVLPRSRAKLHPEHLDFFGSHWPAYSTVGPHL